MTADSKDKVWVIGVDMDQSDMGAYKDKDGKKSNFTLTSSITGVGRGLELVANKATGMHGNIIDAFEAGYTAGVKSVDPNMNVDVQYADSFTDAAKGQTIAKAMMAKGEKVIFQAAGTVGNAALHDATINAAKKNPKTEFVLVDDVDTKKTKNVVSLMFRSEQSSYLAGVAAATKTKDLGGSSVGFIVTDVGGVDDKSFNQSAWEGVQKWGKSHGLEKGQNGYNYFQSDTQADFAPNFQQAINGKYDLVAGIGYII
ncbi:BMP family ABC transporter substrate-binding protein [Weissella confusa]|uniref:BMP family ABC transporter substrate-binding protein n=1 Tax=Weissella confusa TaxID=1583 RepID=A0A923NFA1_WEICO|nr:BMP family ABC transporter substrate-binding protein [Weissella confusa]